MISLEQRVKDIQKYKVFFDDAEPSNHYVRFNCAMQVVSYIAKGCVQNLEEKDCRSFCQEQEMAVWVEKLIDVPGNNLHPHKFALEPIVFLGCGPELSIAMLKGMAEAGLSTKFAVRSFVDGRLAQLSGRPWKFHEPKRKLPFLMPYVRLIESVCNGTVSDEFIADVDKAFSDRMHATVPEDEGLYGSKEIPIKWDHLKAAILYDQQ